MAAMMSGAAAFKANRDKRDRGASPVTTPAQGGGCLKCLDRDGDGEVTLSEWLPHKDKAAAFYSHKYFQAFVACVILSNFFAIVLEKEIDPVSDSVTIGIELRNNDWPPPKVLRIT